MVKVKFCGVTNYDDALLVTNLGADYIGFNFYPESPRKISANGARDIIEKLPPFITSVGVFVDEDVSAVEKNIKKTNIKIVQLHGKETPDYCRSVKEKTGCPVIKVFHIEGEGSLVDLADYKDTVDYFLLDACVEGVPGGTGETFNWDAAAHAADFGKHIFLAGGLTPENVGNAIEKVAPFAVDVASGVERLPRRKDYEKMSAFIRHARGL